MENVNYKNRNTSDHFCTIHDLLRTWIDNSEYEKVCLFLDILTDIETKTALILTKGLKDQPWLKETRIRLLERYKNWCESEGIKPI